MRSVWRTCATFSRATSACRPGQFPVLNTNRFVPATRAPRRQRRSAANFETPISAGPRRHQTPFDRQAWHACEVTAISGDERQSMMKGGRCDLQVSVGKQGIRCRQPRVQFAVHASNGRVIGDHRDRRQNLLVELLEMSLPIGRAIRPSKQLAHRDGAGILLLPRNRGQPGQIRRIRSALQHFRDGVSIEEVRHGTSVEPWCSARRRSRETPEIRRERVGSLPAAGQPGQTSRWPCGLKAPQLVDLRRRHEGRDSSPVLRNHDGAPLFHCSQALGEPRLGCCDAHFECVARCGHNGHSDYIQPGRQAVARCGPFESPANPALRDSPTFGEFRR